MTQYEQVIDALRKLGRWATFNEICEKLDFKQWGTDTPKNSVYMYLTYYYITKKLKKNPIKSKKDGNKSYYMLDEIIGENDNGKDYTDDENYEFAYEKDLQNFLAKNLQLIEPGLKLFEENGITGIEYPAGNRLIDILAVDKNNDFVVIELKASKGYDRVVGQILRYIGWVEQKMASDGQKVRGIIICKEISEDLTLACSKIKEIELFEYELSVKLNRIK